MHNSDNFFTEGRTDKGTEIYFVQSPESQLIMHNHTMGDHKTSSYITIYSNIFITEKMVRSIERSKILRVYKLCNFNQQIIAYPLSGFSYDKLRLALSVLVDEFDL